MGIGFCVRAGQDVDIDWMLACLPKLDDMYGARESLFNTEYARGLLPKIISNHCCIVAEAGGRGLGFIFGMCAPHTLNPTLQVLFEIGWYVEDWAGQKTRGEAAVALVDAFTLWGREHADWILFGLMPVRLVGRAVLSRRGYRESDRTYLLEV